jgi:hypothetical protein
MLRFSHARIICVWSARNYTLKFSLKLCEFRHIISYVLYSTLIQETVSEAKYQIGAGVNALGWVTIRGYAL